MGWAFDVAMWAVAILALTLALRNARGAGYRAGFRDGRERGRREGLILMETVTPESGRVRFRSHVQGQRRKAQWQ